MSNFSKVIFFLIISLSSTIGVAQDGWFQKASHGGNARHRSTAFSIGNKGYFGGGHINSGTEIVYKDYWEYDPSTNTWTQIADYGGGNRYHSVAFTIGSFAYVGCGEDALDQYYNDFWKYSPLVNTWFPMPNFPGNPRRGAASFVIDNLGYVGSGQSDSGYEIDFYFFDPETNAWEPISDFIGLARSGGVGFAYNGKGYFGTGHILGNATKDFYEYDPTLDLWTQKQNVGSYLRQDATGFVINGKGYIATGNNSDGDSTYKDVWEYDFETDNWLQIDDFPGARRRYMVSFVINNVAYCGSGTNGTNLKDFWAFHPLLENDLGLQKNLKIGPNPSNDILTISALSSNLGSIEIYNSLGEIIFQDYNPSSYIVLRSNNLGKGIFFLKMEIDGVYYTEKIIFK